MPDPNDKKAQKTQKEHPGTARDPRQGGNCPGWDALASYFSGIAAPAELMATLERMQMFHIYYCAMEGQDEEELVSDYTNIHEFKRALAQIGGTKNTDANGNTRDQEEARHHGCGQTPGDKR